MHTSGTLFVGALIMGFGLVILYLSGKDNNPLLKYGSWLMMAVGTGGIITGLYMLLAYGTSCQHGGMGHGGCGQHGGYGHHMKGGAMGMESGFRGKRFMECAPQFKGKTMDDATISAIHNCLIGK